MRGLLVVARRELAGLFLSPLAWILLCLTLFYNSFFFLLYLQDYTRGDVDAALLEVGQPVIEGDQFGRADEGEVERIKKDNGVLALGFCRERLLLHFVVAHHGGCGEIGGLLADENGHGISP